MSAQANLNPPSDALLVNWSSWGLDRHLALVTEGCCRMGEERSPAINAKAETLDQNSYFREAINHRRCLIATNGLYEWQVGEDGHTKQLGCTTS